MSKAAGKRSSGIFTCVPGADILYNGARCQVVRVASFSFIVIRDVISSEEHHVKLQDFRPVNDPVEGAPESPVYEVPSEHLDQAVERERELRPYALNGLKVTAEVRDMLCKKLGIGKSRLYQLLKSLSEDPRPAAIASHYRGPKPGTRKLSAEVEAIVKEEIEKLARNEGPGDYTELYEGVELRCYDAELKAPCRETIRHRAIENHREFALKKKCGQRRAKERTTAYPGTIKTTAALALVEIDHSPLDIILVDSVDREVIGRAFITIVLDTHTRCVLGFHISLEHPNAMTVALALQHAMLPKEAWLAERGISHMAWNCFGRIKKLRLDNAKEFKGKALKRGCELWGMEGPQYRDKDKKEQGAYVERVIGTIQCKAANEPGATGSSTKYRRDYDPDHDAQMTLQEAEIWMTQQITQFYHKNWHETLQMSPEKAWELAHTTAEGIVLPEIITDARQLRLDFAPFVWRSITSIGIKHACGRYWTPELKRWVGTKKKYRVKYDTRNVSRVYVEVRRGEYIDVPYSDMSLPALPLFELKARRQRMRRRHKENFDTDGRMEAVREKRQRRAKSAHETKTARRNRERLRQANAATQSTHPRPTVLATPSVDYSVPPTIAWED